MNRVISRVRITLLLILFLVGGFALFTAEFLAKSEQWVLFNGSPHVYNGNGLNLGILTDRDGALLVDMTDGKTYSQAAELRTAFVHWTGDRQGNIAPVIANFYYDKIVNYDPVTGMYAYGETTPLVKLTLSAKIQMVAMEAMGEYKGTVAVYNYKTGELLCAVSTPDFDPEYPPDLSGEGKEEYDGVYLNRFIQSSYTPGSIFKLVTTAAALETIPDIMEQTFVCSGTVEYGVDRVTCEQAHGTLTLKQAFARSCNCSFAQIADQLGGETLERHAAQFGITEKLSFDGFTTSSGSVTAGGEAPVQVAWSAIGQHKDLINPCSFLTFVGAVASGGNGMMPYVVSEIADGNETVYTGRGVESGRIMSSETAATLQSFMRNNVENYYGEEAFRGLTVCAKSGTAEVGGEKRPNAMFVGYVADSECPLAFIVAIEDGGYGRPVCVPVIGEILRECKAQMMG